MEFDWSLNLSQPILSQPSSTYATTGQVTVYVPTEPVTLYVPSGPETDITTFGGIVEALASYYNGQVYL